MKQCLILSTGVNVSSTVLASDRASDLVSQAPAHLPVTLHPYDSHAYCQVAHKLTIILLLVCGPRPLLLTTERGSGDFSRFSWHWKNDLSMIVT